MGTKTKADGAILAVHHVKSGWWLLVGFVSLGVVLESLHGFKVGWYLDASRETRRLLLTLAHAHGTLLALLHLGLGLSLRTGLIPEKPAPTTASRCVSAASVLVPGGFFLGGLFARGGDAGLGILLVPVGALLLLVGLVQLAWRSGRSAA